MNIVYIAASLDGYIAREDGDIEWLTSIQNPPGEDYGYNDFIKGIDAIVMGRGTYEKVKDFPEWPYTRHVYVLSSKLKNVLSGLKDKVTILNMNPGDLTLYLREKGLSALYIDGGKTIQRFLKYDLIDEMIITTIPVLLGRGIPLFGELDNDLQFSHVDTKEYSSGLVKNHYRRIRK